MKHLFRTSVSYLRWFHYRKLGTSAAAVPTSPAAIITETLTKKVGNGAGAVGEAMLAEKKIPMKEKFRLFWESLYADYKDVVVETWNDSKARPVKASFYLSLTGGLLYLWGTNPTEYSYVSELTKYDTEVSFVSTAIRNPHAEQYTQQILKERMKGELRYQSFELFSVVWRHDADKKVGIFEAKCNYLKPLWAEVKERFVDIGFGRRWWMLNWNMQDYDVNPLEWERETKEIEDDKREKDGISNCS